MTENSSDKPEVAADSRRAFIKSSAQVAVTAPAVAMLLGATVRSASAQYRRLIRVESSTSSMTSPSGTMRKTSTRSLGQQLQPQNGQANQDDHVV